MARTHHTHHKPSSTHEPSADPIPGLSNTEETGDFNAEDINLASFAAYQGGDENWRTEVAALPPMTLQELLQAIKITESNAVTNDSVDGSSTTYLPPEKVAEILRMFQSHPEKIEAALASVRATEREALARAEHLERVRIAIAAPNSELGLPSDSTQEERRLEEFLKEGCDRLIQALKLTKNVLLDNSTRAREIAATTGELEFLWEPSKGGNESERTKLSDFSFKVPPNAFIKWRWSIGDIVSIPLNLFKDGFRGGTPWDKAPYLTYQTPVLEQERSPSINELKKIASDANLDMRINFRARGRHDDEFGEISFELFHQAVPQ